MKFIGGQISSEISVHLKHGCKSYQNNLKKININDQIGLDKSETRRSSTLFVANIILI